MAFVRALFYLPLKDNDGRDLTAEIEGVRAELFARFGGWTFEGYVQGAFRMPDGAQVLDISAAYRVFLDRSRVDEIEGILRDFKNNTNQEALYLEIQNDVDVRLIR